ncbi:hypothetical protein BGW80DRAFT_356581 [Lactifluus volemus]|nr:hypothetical protein BGW80DRAFT_356581 [Lactifluus volemus]
MSGAKSKLMCLVWPDDKPYEHILPVKIDDDDIVADLKKLIKVEHAPMLDKVAARDLVLWKCSGLPDGDNLERTLKTIQFDDSDVRSDVRLVRLNNALQPISQLFGDEDLSKEPIHILVEVPALDSVLASSRAASKRDHDGIGSDEKGGKRHKADSSIVDDGPFRGFGFNRLCDDSAKSTKMLDFHKQFWGDRLPREHRDFGDSVHDPNDEENDDENGGENDGDLLPESPRLPIIDSSWSQLLIRAEYLRIYNWVEEKYNDGTENRPPAVVVTGQPGIGKSYWAYYALRRRLGDKSDTLWYQASESYLFCSEGVLIVPAEFLFRKFSERIWTLIDSSQSPGGIPIKLLDGVFPIYLTSPERARWSTLAQSWSDHRAIMNPWTRAEVKYAMSSLISNNEGRINDASQRYDLLGPTAHLCLEMTPDRVEAHVQHRDAQIAQSSPDLFEKIFSSFHEEEQPDLLHKICLIRRKPGSALGHADYTTQLISAAVEQQVAQRLEDFTIDQLLGMWKNFSRLRDTRGLGMAGKIFEVFVHRKFSTSIELNATPMVRSNVAKYCWHALFSNTLPKTIIYGVAQENVPLRVNVDRRFVYAANTPLNIEPNVYYVPRSDQHVAFDSFIFSEGYLNLFQFTAGHSHKIKDGFIKILASWCSGLPAETNLRFVFVLPNDLDSFYCPASDNPTVDEIVGLYTACISMSR